MQRHAKRLLFAGLALAFVGATASPALAQEGEGEEPSFSEEEQTETEHHAEEIAEANGAGEFDRHCIPIIMDGGSVDECQEAPNLLLPETNEIIWGALGFIIVFGLLAKFAFPAMKTAMQERTDKIRGDLQAAEDQRQDAERLQREYQAKLNEARTEAGRILDEARQSAEQIKRDREGALQTELAEMRQRAQTDIEGQKAQATAELRGDLAQLAIGAAETVLQRNLDAASQQQLVEDYIDQVAATSRS